MVFLVGEQPLPNLLPAKHLRPDAGILVHTDRTGRIARNLKSLLEPGIPSELLGVDPYDLASIESRLLDRLANLAPNGEVVLNLTGGTKPMAMAGLEVARQQNLPFIYFQTEGNRSRLYSYQFIESRVTLLRAEDVPETITLDDYLRLYLGNYEFGEPRNAFEGNVAEALRADSRLAEVKTSVRPHGLGALEIDFAVRRGNQVGIGEVKTSGAKAGIDQINAVTHPEYLGTYVTKFLVSGKAIDPNNKELAKAYRLETIELHGQGESGVLSSEDRKRLVDLVVQRLSPLRDRP